MSEAQRTHLREEYGVEVIRSKKKRRTEATTSARWATEVPALRGPACMHLHEGLHELQEILDLEADRSARPRRSRAVDFPALGCARDRRLARYDLGDLRRWVPGACGCGRVSPRFELLGRQGDILSLWRHRHELPKFVLLLSELPGFGGGAEIQIHAFAVR